MLRALLIFAALLLLTACGNDRKYTLGSYQFNAPVEQVAARLVAVASSHSSLSRIDARRPPLQVRSTITGEMGLVTITIPGGADRRDVVLTFKIEPYLDGKYASVWLAIDAPDIEEIDLGPGRFAGTKTLGKNFNEALGLLAGEVNHTHPTSDPARQFARLFDLAAVLGDPALRSRVLSRGKQEGSVDFLFFDQPPNDRRSW